MTYFQTLTFELPRASLQHSLWCLFCSVPFSTEHCGTRTEMWLHKLTWSWYRRRPSTQSLQFLHHCLDNCASPSSRTFPFHDKEVFHLVLQELLSSEVFEMIHACCHHDKASKKHLTTVSWSLRILMSWFDNSTYENLLSRSYYFFLSKVEMKRLDFYIVLNTLISNTMYTWKLLRI